jgi:NAD(P)-dependent dehydrogenase (short-subunit alcohol dehydrogenase family)
LSSTFLLGVHVDNSCAGWGILAACEEQTDHELRSQFETNVYGTFNVIRQTLPILRERETARYINLTSTAGIVGVPGLGPYCATKWAIEGFTESLSQELEGFGCKATIVEIGNAQRYTFLKWR